MSLIRFRDVSKKFGSDADPGGAFYAVRDLSFTVDSGEIVAVVGKTGCGKSTMFNLVTGIIAPTAGTIVVDGRDPFRDFRSLRGTMSIVFQNDRLMPWRTAIENVLLGLEIGGLSHKARRAIGEHWLDLMGLADYRHAYPYELSGGMRQRISIARAFSVDPKILLCDEPFSALDEITAKRLREEFLKLVEQQKITSIFVTHSINEAIQVAKRIFVFDRPARVLDDIVVPSNLDEDTRARLHERITRQLGSTDSHTAPLPESIDDPANPRNVSRETSTV